MKLWLIHHIRTNNFSDPEMITKIQGLWKEASRYLHDPQAATYGVYFDYAGNYREDYSLAVATERNVHADSKWAPIEIAGSAYKTFIVDHTDEMGVVKAWQKIWEQEEAGMLQRAYTVDYEKYYPDSRVEIYIAVRE